VDNRLTKAILKGSPSGEKLKNIFVTAYNVTFKAVVNYCVFPEGLICIIFASGRN